MNILKEAKNGNFRAISKLITIIENRKDGFEDFLNEIYKESKPIPVIGLTGFAGSGKSTLTDKLIKQIRKDEKKVAAILVDPSSTITGGAILGDRIRMQSHTLDAGVFIRSIATRGNLGGISISTSSISRVFAYSGFDYIIIETIGVGQDEIDVIKFADITSLVLLPDMGDEIQAIKSGLMEVADMFIINKCDIKTSDKLERYLEFSINTRRLKRFNEIPIIKTSALKDFGVDELYSKLKVLSNELDHSNYSKRLENEVYQELKNLVDEKIRNFMSNDKNSFNELLDRLNRNEISPLKASKEILDKAINNRK